MTQLLDLPTELLLVILSFFHPVEDRELLLSLCKVSRKTCNTVQPVIFRCFDTGRRCIRCNPDNGRNGGREECQLEPLIPFARTIIARPDLGLRVQKLMIRDHDCTSESILQWPDGLMADTIRHLTAAVQKLGVNSKSRWLSAITGCVFGPFMTMLISQIPNVKELSIVLDWKRVQSFLDLSRRLLRGSFEPYLANLTTLDINCHDGETIEVQTILPILNLPRLQEVSVAYCIGSSEIEWPHEIGPGDLKISAITLSPASLDGECLSRLIEACACLKRFTYVAMDRKGMDSVEPPDIQPALSPQRDTLEELRIKYRPTWNTTIIDPNMRPRYGSFRDFTNLKHLDMEQALMMRVDGLPCSLEVLTIRQADYPIFDMMADLVSANRSDLLSLQEVIITPYTLAPYAMVGLHRFRGADYFASNEGFWTALFRSCQRLENIFEGTGIRLVIDCDVWTRHKTEIGAIHQAEESIVKF